MQAIKYEMLIRMAFGYKKNGRLIDRWEDPATLANTDQFRDDNLAAVKVGAGYAFEIVTTEILNIKGQGMDSAEYSRLEDFTARVVAAEDLTAISAIIEEFNTTVVDCYFNIEEGLISLK